MWGISLSEHLPEGTFAATGSTGREKCARSGVAEIATDRSELEFPPDRGFRSGKVCERGGGGGEGRAGCHPESASRIIRKIFRQSSGKITFPPGWKSF